MCKQPQFLRMTCLAAAVATTFAAAAQPVQDGVTTLDPVVIMGVAPSAPLTFTTDPKLPRQPLPASDGTD